MKLLTNKQDPRNRIIVVDAYINGDRIVCDANSDDFDLWEDCWTIEDLEDEPINPFDTKLFQDGVKEGRRLEREEMKKERQPAEWSEEDEKKRRNLMSLLANMRGDRITEETYQKYYPWLKSLRPDSYKNCNSRWKPSEEQPQVADASKMEPEVDLEKEIDKVIADYSFTKTIDSGGFKTTVIDYAKIARHFYELGLNARKEK